MTVVVVLVSVGGGLGDETLYRRREVIWSF